MQIRKAKMSDLPDLLRLYDHLRGGLAWVKRPPMVATEKHRKALGLLIKDRDCHVLVAQEGRKIVGTCTLYILPRVYWSGKPWAILDSIVVSEESQSKGRGTDLIKHAIALAKKGGCSQINLTSNTRRTRAHRFYETLGFEPTYIGFKMGF
ncbi:MAG TPA: GNAT family N-acetyltransferase [bacterium]|jgi:N-acetylglutamate synthase-like GNAT family acetyltransferase|nr:GNAT family N-acetyltransferase [bacterium]